MDGSRTDFVVRLAGESGEGVLSLGEMLTTALARLGEQAHGMVATGDAVFGGGGDGSMVTPGSVRSRPRRCDGA